MLISDMLMGCSDGDHRVLADRQQLCCLSLRWGRSCIAWSKREDLPELVVVKKARVGRGGDRYGPVWEGGAAKVM